MNKCKNNFQKRRESYCLKGIELQFGNMKKLWRWVEVMVTQECECDK
jgi:hypothetical protein